MQVSKIDSTNVIKLTGAQGIPGASSKITFALAFTIPTSTSDTAVTLADNSLADGEEITGQCMGISGKLRRVGSNYYFTRSTTGTSVNVPIGAAFFVSPPVLPTTNFAEIVYSTSTTIATLVAIASGIQQTDYLVNKYNNKTYQYIDGGWQEISVPSTLTLINKPTGTVFKWDGTKWVPQASRIKVRDWGARGDGATNDSAAIQAAINSSLSNKSDIFFDAGFYICEVVVPNNGIGIDYLFPNLIGEGTTATYLAAPPGKYAINISVMDNVQKAVISDITFTGSNGGIRFGNPANTTNGEYAGGMQFIRCNFQYLDVCVYKPFGNIMNVFESCSFYEANYHFFAESVPTMHAGLDSFYDCHFTQAKKASIYINNTRDGCGGTFFEACVWEANPGIPLFIENYSPNWAPRLTINNCWFEYNAFNYAERQTPPISNPTVVIEGVTYPCKTAYIKNTVIDAHNIQVRDWVLINTCVHVTGATAGEYNSEIATKDADSSLIVDYVYPHPFVAQPGLRVLKSDKIIASKLGSKEIETHPRTQIVHSNNLILSESFALESYTFLKYGGAGSINSYRINDGLLFDSCAELVVPALTEWYTIIFTVPTNKFIVWSGDVRNMFGNKNLTVKLSYDNPIPGDLAGNADDRWHSYMGVHSTFGIAAFNAAIFIGNYHTSAQTIRLSALQILAFDRLQEANDYLNNKYYATNTPKVLYGAVAPTTGTWSVGDICYNTNPTAGGTLGWVCVASGAPGTWKTFGAISA